MDTDLALIAAAGALLFPALSAGIALALGLAKPRWSVAQRSFIASGLAAGLPISLAIGGLFTEIEMLWSGGASDFLLGLLALVLVGVMLAAMLCLPGAWFVARRMGDAAQPAALGSEPTGDYLSGA